jgi:hypothetical protein
MLDGFHDGDRVIASVPSVDDRMQTSEWHPAEQLKG